MSKLSKLIVLLGVLALSAGCSFDESQYPKPDAEVKSPDVVVSAPEPLVEEEVEEVDNSVAIYIGNKKLVSLSDNVTSGKVNSLELAKTLHNLLSGNLYSASTNEELLKYFDQSTLTTISNTLAFVLFDEYNWTVGYGLNNNGQTEVIKRYRENNINQVVHLIFHSKNNKLDLVDMLYMINTYIHIDPNYDDSITNNRICWDSKTSVVVECGPKNNVIQELSATEPSNTNVVVNWSVLHDKVEAFELEIVDEDNESNIYKVAGSARNFLLYELKSRTHYVICLRALVNGVWSEIVTIRHRTKR